jgi:hypothetical protein
MPGREFSLAVVMVLTFRSRGRWPYACTVNIYTGDVPQHAETPDRTEASFLTMKYFKSFVL